jgi:hypothetical protein
MRYIAPVLIAVLFFGMSTAEARKVTITQRQQMIVAKIASSERSGELTKDEAISLKNEDAKITEKITVMKNKNGGKLSYADINQIEKDLNKLSEKLQKKSLDKRVK